MAIVELGLHDLRTYLLAVGILHSEQVARSWIDWWDIGWQGLLFLVLAARSGRIGSRICIPFARCFLPCRARDLGSVRSRIDPHFVDPAERLLESFGHLELVAQP